MGLPKNIKEFILDYPPLSLIGNTSMIKLDIPMHSDSIDLYAKCEHLNPGGSIKDRPVLRMLVEAILSGDLTKDKTILDATSGNAGISYAMIGAILGYKVKLIMPENDSEERIGGTTSSCIYAILQGVQILRVHDVNEIRQAMKVFNKLIFNKWTKDILEQMV